MNPPGDEWRNGTCDEHRVSPTRREMQQRINEDYVARRLSLIEWQRGTEHLSGCCADGSMMDATARMVRR
jgi:hypothetical protein